MAPSYPSLLWFQRKQGLPLYHRHRAKKSLSPNVHYYLIATIFVCGLILWWLFSDPVTPKVPNTAVAIRVMELLQNCGGFTSVIPRARAARGLQRLKSLTTN